MLVVVEEASQVVELVEEAVDVLNVEDGLHVIVVSRQDAGLGKVFGVCLEWYQLGI